MKTMSGAVARNRNVRITHFMCRHRGGVNESIEDPLRDSGGSKTIDEGDLSDVGRSFIMKACPAGEHNFSTGFPRKDREIITNSVPTPR